MYLENSRCPVLGAIGLSRLCEPMQVHFCSTQTWPSLVGQLLAFDVAVELELITVIHHER